MNTKMIVAALVGSVASFLLGWVVWGMLMMPYYEANTVNYPGLFRDEATMRLWAIYVGQLAWSGLLAYIFSAWANISTFGKGFMGGAIVFGLVSLGINFMMFAQFNLHTYQVYIIDTLINVAFGGIVGGIIAFVLGYGKKAAA